MQFEAVDMTELMLLTGQPTHPPLWGVKAEGDVVASFEDIPSLELDGKSLAEAFAETLTVVSNIKEQNAELRPIP